ARSSALGAGAVGSGWWHASWPPPSLAKHPGVWTGKDRGGRERRGVAPCRARRTSYFQRGSGGPLLRPKIGPGDDRLKGQGERFGKIVEGVWPSPWTPCSPSSLLPGRKEGANVTN